jgi:hypothetical protein
MKFDETKTKAIQAFCAEMSASFSRQVAERDFQKEAVAHIVEKYELGKDAKKILKKMAKVHHNAKFQSLVEESEEFQETFKSVFGDNE